MTTILEPTECTNARSPRFIHGDALADYAKYMTDESRRSGSADALAFPLSTAEVCGAVREAVRRGMPITVSGARTGIAAGAVPEGGLLLSLERLNRVKGLRREDADLLVHCEAGVLLSDIQQSLATGQFADSGSWDEQSRSVLAARNGTRWFYPPDPTETGAALGGTIACNASGAHSFLYGPTRPYVHRLVVVLADGRILDITRGETAADEAGRFGLRMSDGTVRWEQAPTYRWPATKNAGGYLGGPGRDLIDLFIGSEGTLGIITEADIRAIPAPESSCAVMTFWRDEQEALDFTKALRAERAELGVEAIEYVGPNALTMLRDRRRQLGSVSGVPACIPADAACGIYLDIGTDDADMPDTLGQLATLTATHNGNPELCWSAAEKDERERLRLFRHALPETVNAIIAQVRRNHPTVTKLGTDMAVPDERLDDVVRLYRATLDPSGLDYVIFGHIGDNHLHVNILPRSPAEYEHGWELYHLFATNVVAMGGSPAAEHGIGKLKTDFLRTLYGDRGLADMRRIKVLFDPHGRLGRGTLFESPTKLS